MRIRRAVITAAGPAQRRLPLQNLVDRDGREKSVLGILLEEIVRAKVDEICVVICAGDAEVYARTAGDHAGRVRFVEQPEPRGYGHAVWCAREFTGDQPFLHLVSDHLYVSRGEGSCASELVAVAEAEECAVSAVQATREGQLTRFGAVGGQRVAGRNRLYQVDTVIEKPTPTEAEQRLVVPGLRAGHYLCFFGMHVLTPGVMELLNERLSKGGKAALSEALAETAKHERYLAVEMTERRYDLGAKFGLLNAQLALALSGQEREQVLSELVELLAQREQGTAR
ncbi:MAG: UTP--glucose-1-phosphate uridylyltransferase [Acidobacteria bacterium]|nr:UTP--glucose-1-phosphate uridylyltransferase [Acidobacteriota bacterium]